MKLLRFRAQRAPGFRLNISDLMVILALGILAHWLHGETWLEGLWLVPVYIGVTFFLFCNVFRIGNRMEPLWYVPFAVTAAWCVWSADLALLWKLVFCVFEPLKWVLVAYRIWRGPYRGILAERLSRFADTDAGFDARGKEPQHTHA